MDHSKLRFILYTIEITELQRYLPGHWGPMEIAEWLEEYFVVVHLMEYHQHSIKHHHCTLWTQHYRIGEFIQAQDYLWEIWDRICITHGYRPHGIVKVTADKRRAWVAIEDHQLTMIC